jgi:hypothetical protein
MGPEMPLGSEAKVVFVLFNDTSETGSSRWARISTLKKSQSRSNVANVTIDLIVISAH